VLLVKKKDKSYRLCIGYRHLNAITMKGQYHVPIIDEFLDELRGASLFSIMDLCSQFHQIPMSIEDCFKTAFQTHSSHFEFKVMSFTDKSSTHLLKSNEFHISSTVKEVCFGVFLTIF
jgi:hypothetical protein